MPAGRGVARRTKGFYLAVYRSHPAVTFGVIPLCTVEKLFKGGIFILNTNTQRRSLKLPTKTELTCSIFSREYWREARGEFLNSRTLIFAALIIALRVVIKAAKIPLAAGLSLTFDCYVNALGSIVYGPIVALMVGAISDSIGCILFPTGPYFFPFIFVEMSSSFIFALYLWRRKITVGRVLLTKFTVNFICNIILTSTFVKWMYIFFGDKSAATYNIINLTRIGKNLVLFPLEASLIVIILGAFIPVLKGLKVVPSTQGELVLKKKHIVMIVLTALLSVALILFYVFFLKQFISDHNIKLF